jgi:gliding motility-associated-like protein
MRLTNRCGLDTTIVQKVKINAPPPKPTIAPASALCNGPITLNANTGNIASVISYLWSNGATTKTILITNPAAVSVTTTDVNGCTNKASAIVADNRPLVDLGPDLNVCQTSATPNLNALNPGATFLWKLNGVANGNTTAVQAIDTTLPAALTYSVTVTDPITTCTVTDSKVYTVKVSPVFTLTGTNPTACTTATGTITMTLTKSVPPGGPYSYFISGSSITKQGFDQVAPSTVGPLPGVKAGTISGILTDQISGCTTSTSIGLTDPSPYTFTTAIVPPNCDPVTYTVTAAPGTTQLNQYKITNSATVAIVQGPTALANVSTFNTQPLPVGSYTVEVKDAGGCIVTNPLTVAPIAAPVIVITPSCTTLTASSVAPGVTYNWTTTVPGTISGATNGASIQMTGIGTVTYTVTGSNGGCAGTQSITVKVPTPPVPDFTQSTGCSSQTVLTATPAGNYTYRWYKAGALQALGGKQITLGISEDGASYAVEVVDATSGCFVRSAAKAIAVTGPVDASLTATQACQDSKPFTLTAATVATGSGITYTWALNGTAITGATNSTLNETREGTYKVTIAKSTCSASASIKIIKAPIPQGQLLDQVIICNDPENKDPLTSQVDLNPGAFTNYKWFKNQVDIKYTKQTYTATSEGIYQVDLTNSFGCVNSDQTEVLNECLPKIIGPNAFRPANAENALNKEFFVYSFFVSDNFEIAIFNRWGEMVFESKKKDFKWNGGYSNNASQPAPSGTYSYVIKYESSFRPQDGVKEQRGGIVLLR